MSPEQLVAAALAARSAWVPLADGKRVRLRRPSEHDTRRLVVRTDNGGFKGLRAEIDDVCHSAVDWDGFRECDIVASGADDPVPFQVDVFRVWVEDRREALKTLSEALIAAVIEHEKQRIDTEKN